MATPHKLQTAVLWSLSRLLMNLFISLKSEKNSIWLPVPIFHFLLNISNKNEWPEPKPANQFVSGNFYSDPVRFGLPTLALISDRVQKKPGSRFGNESVFRLEAGSGSVWKNTDTKLLQKHNIAFCFVVHYWIVKRMGTGRQCCGAGRSRYFLVGAGVKVRLRLHLW